MIRDHGGLANATRRAVLAGSLSAVGLGAALMAVDGEYRVIQFTPQGSECSVIFDKNVIKAAPGSVHGSHLIVSDVVTARDELLHH
jgi:hypothetical protein